MSGNYRLDKVLASDLPEGKLLACSWTPEDGKDAQTFSEYLDKVSALPTPEGLFERFSTCGRKRK